MTRPCVRPGSECEQTAGSQNARPSVHQAETSKLRATAIAGLIVVAPHLRVPDRGSKPTQVRNWYGKLNFFWMRKVSSGFRRTREAEPCSHVHQVGQ